MKKLIILMMLLFSISVFSEKLTSDGKDNLNKLRGSWGNSFYQIIPRGNIWYLGVYDMNYSTDNEYIWYKISKYKNSAFIIYNYHPKEARVRDRNLYFAYDTKYKTMVELDRDFNIIEKIKRKIDKSVN